MMKTSTVEKQILHDEFRGEVDFWKREFDKVCGCFDLKSAGELVLERRRVLKRMVLAVKQCSLDIEVLRAVVNEKNLLVDLNEFVKWSRSMVIERRR